MAQKHKQNAQKYMMHIISTVRNDAIMAMLDKLKGAFKKNEPEENGYLLTLELNARLQPLDRGDFYEDPILEALEACGCGYVDGGGTLMQESGEVALCDIHIVLNGNTKENMDALLRIIDEIAVPKGSFLKAEGLELPVGKLEGLALYLGSVR